MQIKYLYEALDLIEKTKDYPEGARFKWHAEGMWAVDEFLRTAPEEKKQQYIKALRDQSIHLRTECRLYAIGRHVYIGNMGAVSATAHAAFQDQHLGSYTAERQNYTPFLVDFGEVKDIWASAKVYTDKTCGLTALGDSKHSAWWQFYQGRAAPLWGVTKSYSQGQPAHQRPCSNTTTTTSGGGDGSTGGMICYVLITWDLDTGQIVNTQILACTGAGDEQW